MAVTNNPARQLVVLFERVIAREDHLRSLPPRGGDWQPSYRTCEVWQDSDLQSSVTPGGMYLWRSVGRLGEALMLLDSTELRLRERDFESVELLGLAETYDAVRTVIGREAGNLTAVWHREAPSKPESRWLAKSKTIVERPQTVLDPPTLKSLRVCAQLLRASSVLSAAEVEQVEELRAEGAEVRTEAETDETLSPPTRDFLVDSVTKVDEALANAETEGLRQAGDAANYLLHSVLRDQNLGSEVAASTTGKKVVTWASKIGGWAVETTTKAAMKAAIDPWVQHVVGQLLPGGS